MLDAPVLARRSVRADRLPFYRREKDGTRRPGMFRHSLLVFLLDDSREQLPWRQFVFRPYPLPEMQAERMQVHVLVLPGMELHNRFVVPPEQVLDRRHLIPRWASGRAGNRNVFPILALRTRHARRNDEQRTYRKRSPVSAGIASGSSEPVPVQLEVRFVSHSRVARFSTIRLPTTAASLRSVR